MTESQYKKRVLPLKNGFGRSMCVIAEQEGTTTAFLIKNDGQTPVYVYKKDGKYEEGKAEEEKYEFSPMTIEDICAVIYGGFEKTGEPLKTSFVGFAGEECEIKPFGNIGKKEEKTQGKKKEQEIQKEEKKEEHKEIKPQNLKKTKPIDENKIKYAPVIEEYEKMKKQDSAQNNFKKIIEIFSKEMQNMEKSGVLDKKDVEYIETGKTNKSSTDRLFESRKKTEPFKDSDYDWVVINAADMWQTEISDCKCIMNPMVILSEIKYHHLALGKNKETGKYVFAVPEKFSENDKKTAKKLGFKDFWFCEREKSPFGYWVMDIK